MANYVRYASLIRTSRAKFHCNRLTAVQDIQDYVSLIFWDTLYICSFNHLGLVAPNSVKGNLGLSLSVTKV